MRTWNWQRAMVFCAGLAVATGTSSAAVLSFQGAFDNDSQTERFSFVAGSTGVVIQTVSYAGGFNASGRFVGGGGFDPVISLFGPGIGNVISPSTPLIGTNDDGATANIDPFTGAALDAVLDTNAAFIALIPGRTYFVVLSQSGNFPNSNFFQNGFSGVDTSLFGCSNGRFCDVTASNRDGHWALDIIGAANSFNSSFPLPLAPNPFTFGPIVPTSVLSKSTSGDDGDSGSSGSSGSGGNSGTGGNSGNSGSPAGNSPVGALSDPNNPTAFAAPGGNSDNGSSGSGSPGSGDPGVQSLTSGDVSANAIPEPGSVILIGAGIAALLVRQRLARPRV